MRYLEQRLWKRVGVVEAGVVEAGVSKPLWCIIIVMSVVNRKLLCRYMLGVHSNECSKHSGLKRAGRV